MVASLVVPALGFSHHGHFSSWHLPVILGCLSAIDPVLVRNAHHAHWKEKIKCHHLNCHMFLANFTLEGTAFVHFWVYMKSMSMRVDTVDRKGGIFWILQYSNCCCLCSLSPWASPTGNCMELQKANSTLNVTNENATSPVIEFWE